MSGGPEPRPCGGDGARDPGGLWLELGPACPGAPRCPSESSGPTSGDLGTSSSSSGSSTGLSPGSDSDSSGVVCSGRAAGMRGAPSRSRSLESLRSASAGKGAVCSPAPPASPQPPLAPLSFPYRLLTPISPRFCPSVAFYFWLLDTRPFSDRLIAGSYLFAKSLLQLPKGIA